MGSPSSSSALTFSGLGLQLAEVDGQEILQVLVDPESLIGKLLGSLPGVTAAPSPTPTAPGKPKPLIGKLDRFFTDPNGRLNVFSPVRAATGLPALTIATHATNYPIQTPPGARRLKIRLEGTNPTNNIAGYWSPGVIWGQLNPMGLAYDPSQVNTPNGGYTGYPLKQSTEEWFDLDPSYGSINLAATTDNTIAIIGFLS